MNDQKKYYTEEDGITGYWEKRYVEWLKTPDWGVFETKAAWFNSRFAHILPIPKEPKGLVLDYGCGNGMYSVPLLQRFENYVGMDTSPTAIEIARNRLGQSRQRAFWLSRENPKDGWQPFPAYDLVISITVLQHQPVSRRRDIIEWIKGVIKPGGMYVGLEMQGNTQAFDMPPMPEDDWRKAWEPFTIRHDVPKEHPEWAQDNVWVARVE